MNDQLNEHKNSIESEDLCGTTCVHEVEVARCREKMPDEAVLCALGDFFKTFGDSTRIRIVSALISGELCVCDIGAALDMSVSAVSHQLRVLRQAQIVRTRRDGKQIFYSIDDQHVGILFSVGLEHVREGLNHRRFEELNHRRFEELNHRRFEEA